MIINTGMRTDISAFYSEWFLNRLKAGFVLVRNPYDATQVTRYRLSPDVVDLIGFCTKNPISMLPHMDALRNYGQYWFVTITPYGKEIELHVPLKRNIIEAFKQIWPSMIRNLRSSLVMPYQAIRFTKQSRKAGWIDSFHCFEWGMVK